MMAPATRCGCAVDNLAALRVMSDTTLVSGTIVSVATLDDLFSLDKASTTPPDDITVAMTASGIGRWIRKLTSSEKWLRHGDWYVNAATGDDENSGAVGQPLATLAEYARRIGDHVVTAPLHYLYLETDLDEPAYELRGSYTYGLIVQGTRTTVHAGIITGVQSWDPAQRLDGRITDSALPISWTASGLVGKAIALTSGPYAGATGYVARDLGSKTARVLFWDVNVGRIDPPVGSAYVVYEPTQIRGPYRHAASGVLGVEYVDVAFPEVGAYSGLRIESGPVFLLYTTVGAVHSLLTTAHGGNVVALGSLFVIPGATFQVFVGEIDLYGCTVGCDVRTASPAGFIGIWGDTLFQHDLAAGTAELEAREGGLLEIGPAFMASYDGPASAALNVQDGSVRLRPGSLLYGYGWTGGYGVWVGAGGRCFYPDGSSFTDHVDVRGSGTFIDTQVGGTDRTYTAIGYAGYVESTNLAMIVPARYQP